jgi:hypothetical protein
MAVAQIQAGTSTVNVTGKADGSTFRTSKHPDLMQGVLDGVTFTGANPLGTPVTTQAGLSATTPALTLYNPIGSGVNLVLTSVSVCPTAAPAAATTIALAYNLANAAAPTSTTAATVTSNMLGSTTSPVGQAYRVATLAAAPVAFVPLGGIVAASSTNQVGLFREFKGEYVVTPGTAISIQATTAVAILASISWKEVSTSAA